MNESSKNNLNLVSAFVANDDELDEETTNNIKVKTIDKLKKIGAQDQLLMFVMCPAGAGKSSAIEFAPQFWLNFAGT